MGAFIGGIPLTFLGCALRSWQESRNGHTQMTLSLRQLERDRLALGASVVWFEGNRGVTDTPDCRQYMRQEIIFHEDMYYVWAESIEFSSSWHGAGKGPTVSQAFENMMHRDSCEDPATCGQDHTPVEFHRQR